MIGEEEGIHKGKVQMITRLLRKRFGSLPETMTKAIDAVEEDAKLNELTDVLLDFTSLADAQAWLDARRAN
jgi:hypothetical protein